MSKARVLIAEDDKDLREALVDTLEMAGFDVVQVESGESALEYLKKHTANLVVSDVNMGGINGHELLDRLRRNYPQVPVLLITAYGDISSAVNAMRSGAVDYLIKPFKPQVLVEAVVRYACGNSVATDEVDPIAIEKSSIELLQIARRVAVTDSTVLISGESGTGKEVLARYIHVNSPRVSGPFIAINCAAIPENMLEATLFGYEKGAFTGAYASSAGKFEQAHGGTILLDEISEMDLGLQAKMLRVLQEREVERIGGKKVLELDVRVIATTNRNLQDYVAEHKFREDLYYRLSVFPMQWLPLRQRPKDIPVLAERLIQAQAQKMNRVVPEFSAEAMDKLTSHSWPGNVRELDNVIQRALIMQSGEKLTADNLFSSPVSERPRELTVSAADTLISASGVLDEGMKSHEHQLIIDALKHENGRKNRAAEKLGISPRTLRYKIAKMRESGVDLEASLAAG